MEQCTAEVARVIACSKLLISLRCVDGCWLLGLRLANGVKSRPRANARAGKILSPLSARLGTEVLWSQPRHVFTNLGKQLAHHLVLKVVYAHINARGGLLKRLWFGLWSGLDRALDRWRDPDLDSVLQALRRRRQHVGNRGLGHGCVDHPDALRQRLGSHLLSSLLAFVRGRLRDLRVGRRAGLWLCWVLAVELGVVQPRPCLLSCRQLLLLTLGHDRALPRVGEPTRERMRRVLLSHRVTVPVVLVWVDVGRGGVSDVQRQLCEHHQKWYEYIQGLGARLVDGISWRICASARFCASAAAGTRSPEDTCTARFGQARHKRSNGMRVGHSLTRVIQTGGLPSLIPTDQHDGGSLGTAVI
jgi:hypothetical protein